MATNIEMNILKADGNYDTLYPKTLGSLVNGAVASATNATTATKLQTGRTIRTNLGSVNSATFDGSSDITPGITGTLSTSYGGTSANSAPGGLYNLIVGCSARTASQVNSYASSTYLGAYYSTTGYRIAISNLLTYFQNNLSSGNTVKILTGSRNGTGSSSGTISLLQPVTIPIIYGQGRHSGSSWTSPGLPAYYITGTEGWSGTSTGSEFLAGFNIFNNECFVECISKAKEGYPTNISIKRTSFTTLSFTLGTSASTDFNESGYTYDWFLIAI